MYEILKVLLEEKNLTFYKLSKELHISQSTFSKWKNNNILPNIRILNKIANFLKVDVNFLIGNKEQKDNIEENNLIILSDLEKNFINDLRNNKEQKEILNIYNNLTKEKKEKFLNICNILKDWN